MSEHNFRRVDAPKFAGMMSYDCAECGHPELGRPVFLAEGDGPAFPVGSGCAERLTGRAAAEWDADLAAAFLAGASDAVRVNVYGFLVICRPARVTAKFRAELIARAYGVSEADIDATIAAYKALGKVGAVRGWEAR
jgi:hypothetical protein